MTSYPVHSIRIHTSNSLFVDFPDGRLLRIDQEGRWSSWQNGDALYRRTLNGEIIKISDQTYNKIAENIQSKIFQRIKELLILIRKKIGDQSNELYLSSGNYIKVKNWIQKAIHRLSKPLGYEKKLYEKAYPKGIQILPPDRYRDLVIQPAFGCPSGNCTFCAFYKNKRFRVRSDQDFSLHLQAVKNLFGAAIKYRNGIFLDSGSALSLSQRRITKVLDAIEKTLPNTKRGVAAFLDPNHSPKRGAREYAALKKRGLAQVTIGLETGYPQLRKKLGKSKDLASLKETINALKKAGIQVALTVLVGAGGADYIDIHKSKTIRFIQNLNLTPEDIIYLSPLRGALSPSSLRSETAAFKDSLKYITNSRISPYNMDRFYYFS